MYYEKNCIIIFLLLFNNNICEAKDINENNYIKYSKFYKILKEENYYIILKAYNRSYLYLYPYEKDEPMVHVDKRSLYSILNIYKKCQKNKLKDIFQLEYVKIFRNGDILVETYIKDMIIQRYYNNQYKEALRNINANSLLAFSFIKRNTVEEDNIIAYKRQFISDDSCDCGLKHYIKLHRFVLG